LKNLVQAILKKFIVQDAYKYATQSQVTTPRENSYIKTSM